MELGDALEEAALNASGEADGEDTHNGVPTCPTCGQPTDDIQHMTEGALLLAIRMDLMRDLARALRTGTATHQEKAIAKALLRDNLMRVNPAQIREADGEQYEDEPEAPIPSVPVRRPRKFDEGNKG